MIPRSILHRNLLADRFQLRYHHETREIPAYVLTVGNSGTKLKRSESQEIFDVPIKPDGSGRVVGTGVPMSYLSWYLSLHVGRPVVDGTALEGFYDFALAWLPNPGLESPGVLYNDSSEEPAILVAVREQLGLKSQQRKAPVEVLIIDRVVKPQAN